jgi:hypothetical protein
LNYVGGFLVFLTNIFSPNVKKAFLSHHIPLGILILVVAALAAETGIMELSTEAAKCTYDVTSADTNPASHYSQLLPGCKLANGAGILILLSVVCTLYALIDIRLPNNGRDDKDIHQPLSMGYDKS